jgi:DNA helicase-2/ATP-dependent DNA helicase PcrA
MIDGWTGAGSFLGSEVPASLAALVERVIDESGLRAHYFKQAAASQTETDAERIDNLDELISSARQFEEEFDPAADPLAFPGDDALTAGEEAEVPPLLAMLRGFIESITLVADADAVDSGQGAVTLMTLHAAKGLEFPAVAMIGLEEGMLPHMRAMESESDLEEERRLTFVGITRAMRHLQISSAKYRTIRGMTQRTIPSRFLEEIRGEHVIESDQAGDFAYEDEDQDLGSSSAGSGNGQSIEAKLAGLKHRKAERSSQSAEAARRKFPIGSRVRHPQFGEGEVVDADGVGSSARLRIRFKGIGVKTLVLEYARLTRVG